jgi:hypothetical protein
MRWITLAALVLVVASLPSSAQGGVGSGDKVDMDSPVELTSVDLTIPTQPAVHLLGVEPSKVQKPTNLRELLLTAINSTDQRGNLQQGFSCAITGWRLQQFRGTAADYKRKRMKLDTEFSIAAVKGASDEDQSARLGVGVSVPLIDQTRPFRDAEDIRQYFLGIERLKSADSAGLRALLADVRARLREVEPVEGSYSEPLGTLGDVKEALVYLDDVVETSDTAATVTDDDVGVLWDAFAEVWAAERKKHLKKRTEERWNASALSIAGGLAWVSPTGLTEDFRSDRYGLWLRGANPMGKKGQLLYAASYRDRETVPDPNNEGESIRQNAWFVGGRYLYGGATQGVSLEVSYSIENPEEGDSERVCTYLLGYEQRVTKDQWLQMSIGTEGNRSTGDQLLFGLSYNMGLGNKAQIRKPTNDEK